MDSINFPFEKNTYDTIIIDPPYLTEEEFSNNLIKKEKWLTAINSKEYIVYDLNCALIVDRIFQYAYNHKTWLIVFHKRELRLSQYSIKWKREKAGLGFGIGRNAEYIHLVNYFGGKIKTLQKGSLQEIEDIPKTRERTCAKPVKLFEKLFCTLESKKIFDPFAGWGNSVIAAKNGNLQIDAFDKDSSLQSRYDFLNNYQPSGLDSFLATEEVKT